MAVAARIRTQGVWPAQHKVHAFPHTGVPGTFWFGAIYRDLPLAGAYGPIHMQVDAEERARESASQGLARKLREAEARCEALAESCGELRDALDRQRQAADLREEMLKVGRRPPL